MPQNKPVKLKKHKMIARAFAKRRDLQNGSRMSVSFVSTHDDPVGKFLSIISLVSAAEKITLKESFQRHSSPLQSPSNWCNPQLLLG